MNQEKRKHYNLHASFHTLEIKSEPPTKTDKKVKGIKSISVNNDGTEATVIINPNKRYGDIFRFSDFQKIFSEILMEIGVEQYRITRSDLRLDNYNPEHYEAFAKLNRYLLSAFMVTYKTENNYRTTDLVTDEQLSIAVKNRYFEVENYDRNRKNKVTGNTTEPAKARFEQRTMPKQWYTISDGKLVDGEENMDRLREEFSKHWRSRWEKSLENLNDVQTFYNDALAEKYFKTKDVRPVQFRSTTEFVMQNQNSIFTKAQLVNLLQRIGVENPESTAKSYKKRYSIEYFSQSDVKYAVKQILGATQDYFEK